MSTAIERIEPFDERLSGRSTFLGRARRSRSLVAGCSLTGVIALSAIFAPLLSPASPEQQDLYHILSGVSSAHPLGTDQLGRDELSRLLYAGRTDLTVGVLAIVFPLIFGTLVGTLAGYFRGITDAVISRVIEVVIAFPFLVLVIGLVFVVGPGTRGIYIAFAIADWIVYARAVRATTLVVRESDYVAAARAGGLSTPRILWSHVLPNTITQAIVYAMTDVVLVIVAVVTLGYVGLGVQPPDFDWGSMINDGQEFLTTRWQLATIPGLAVVLTGLGLSLIGDGLADVLRPQ
ncbi:MAG: peptide/nickel transport system permease protein [Gaiellales bacterium]|nr:peptide/nickel transport system permease protein [Gaiellales bacterium]